MKAALIKLDIDEKASYRTSGGGRYNRAGIAPDGHVYEVCA